MKTLKETFNDIFTMDRLKGAVMGASAGYMLTGGQPAGALLLGLTGAFLGAENLTATFNAAVSGHQMALQTVPVLVKTAAQALKR